jgi:hypothetical protein
MGGKCRNQGQFGSLQAEAFWQILLEGRSSFVPLGRLRRLPDGVKLRKAKGKRK